MKQKIDLIIYLSDFYLFLLTVINVTTSTTASTTTTKATTLTTSTTTPLTSTTKAPTTTTTTSIPMYLTLLVFRSFDIFIVELSDPTSQAFQTRSDLVRSQVSQNKDSQVIHSNKQQIF